MASIEQEIRQLTKDFNEAKNEQVRIETKLESAKTRRKEAHQKIKDKGQEPKTLSKVISSKEDELKQLLADARGYLPSDESDDDDEYEDDDE